jgi:hypothetical protein
MTKALYYPYTSLSTIKTLSAAAVLFDEISLINPLDVSIDLAANSDCHTKFYIAERTLRNIKYVPINHLLNNEFDRELCINIIHDLLETDYQDLCSSLDNGLPSRLSISKISELELDARHRKYYVNLPSVSDGLNFQNKVKRSHMDHKMYDAEKLNYLRISDERKFVYDAKDKNKMITLPFEYVQSLMINHALILARESGSLLFTDSAIASRILNFKLYGLSKSPQNIQYENNLMPSGKISTGPIDVFNMNIPLFDNLGLPTIGEFYDENNNWLERVRQEITDINTTLQNNCWNDALYDDIRVRFNTILKPLIQEIIDFSMAFKDKLSAKSASPIKIKFVNLILTIFPNVNFELALQLSRPRFQSLYSNPNANTSKLRNGISYFFKDGSGLA